MKGDSMQPTKEIQNITQQLISLYSPQKLLLFGSQAKRTSKVNSDIDLCAVMPIPKTMSRRRLLADMYYQIQSEKPIDIILYTPEQWAENIQDKTSFAHKINIEGVVLYGG